MFHTRRVASYGIFAQLKCFKPNRFRSLFTRDALGITAYEASRELEVQYRLKPDEFKAKFKNSIEQCFPLHMIKDNLKTFVHIMDDSLDDANLLYSGLRLYGAQQSQLESRGGDLDKNFYSFGSIVMRAFYHLGLLNQAIEFFEDSEIGSLFKQITTFEILLDWLYDNKLYGELLRLNESMQQWIRDQHLHSSAAMYSIVFATYFRLNTSKHHRLAFELYQHLEENGTAKLQYRKTVALIAEMKRREKQSQECLDILAPYDDIDVNIRYIKILANLELNRFEEVFRLVRITIDAKSDNRKNVPKIPNQLLRTIENGLAKRVMSVEIEEYQKMFKQLKQLDRIMSKPLDDVLCGRFPSNVMKHEKRTNRYRPVPKKILPKTLK